MPAHRTHRAAGDNVVVFPLSEKRSVGDLPGTREYEGKPRFCASWMSSSPSMHQPHSVRPRSYPSFQSSEPGRHSITTGYSAARELPLLSDRTLSALDESAGAEAAIAASLWGVLRVRGTPPACATPGTTA